MTSPPDRWHLLLDLGKLVTSPLNWCGYPQSDTSSTELLTVTGTSLAPNLFMAAMPFRRILSILQPNLVQSRCPPQTPNSMVRSMVRHVPPQTLVLPVEDPWNKQLGDWRRNRRELGHSRRDVQAAVGEVAEGIELIFRVLLGRGVPLPTRRPVARALAGSR